MLIAFDINNPLKLELDDSKLFDDDSDDDVDDDDGITKSGEFGAELDRAGIALFLVFLVFFRLFFSPC